MLKFSKLRISRKIEMLKACGREVLIEVSKENVFLQKEKVSIKYILNDDSDESTLKILDDTSLKKKSRSFIPLKHKICVS